MKTANIGECQYCQLCVYVYVKKSKVKKVDGIVWSVICVYKLGTVNLNTVNSKFHLIRSFFEIVATFLLFHV